MKLGVLTHGFPTDQNPIAANFLEPFLEEISKQGHSVWVITPRMGKQKPLPQSYPIEVFDWRGGEKLLGQLKLWNPADLLSLLKFLRAQKETLMRLNSEVGFDHVLAVWMIPNALAARSLKRKRGVEYSTWSLGTDINRFAANPIGRPLLKGLMKEASHIFANSHNLCSKIASLSGKTVELLPTYRPLEEPDPQLIPKLDSNAFNFLCVARLEPVKGPDVLVEAFINLLSVFSEDKKVHLHILGDGTMRKGLEIRVKEAGVASQVHFYGMVPPERVAGFLKVTDCLVLPSRNESMPVSFWEAQAAGVPVIGTDVGDLGWAIKELGQGIVIQSEDVEGLVAAMKRAVKEGKNILEPNPKAIPPDPKRSAHIFLKAIEDDE